jgi:hypothetical protein
MLRLWLAIAVGVACLVGSGVIASMARAQAGGDPAAVITAYEMARNRGDIDGALSYFADNAVISQRNTTFSGKDEIRRFLTGVSARSRFIVVTDRQTVGNEVTWIERNGGGGGSGQTGTAQVRPSQSGTGPATGTGGAGLAGAAGGTGTQRYPGAVVTPTSFAVTVDAVVQDGKIQSMAYTFGNQPTPLDLSLQGRAQLPASVGLAAVLAVLLISLTLASSGIGRPSPVASSLRGRLMQDLQGWAAARE